MSSDATKDVLGTMVRVMVVVLGGAASNTAAVVSSSVPAKPNSRWRYCPTLPSENCSDEDEDGKVSPPPPSLLLRRRQPFVVAGQVRGARNPKHETLNKHRTTATTLYRARQRCATRISMSFGTPFRSF